MPVYNNSRWPQNASRSTRNRKSKGKGFKEVKGVIIFLKFEVLFSKKLFHEIFHFEAFLQRLCSVVMKYRNKL